MVPEQLRAPVIQQHVEGKVLWANLAKNATEPAVIGEVSPENAPFERAAPPRLPTAPQAWARLCRLWAAPSLESALPPKEYPAHPCGQSLAGKAVRTLAARPARRLGIFDHALCEGEERAAPAARKPPRPTV